MLSSNQYNFTIVDYPRSLTKYLYPPPTKEADGYKILQTHSLYSKTRIPPPRYRTFLGVVLSS